MAYFTGLDQAIVLRNVFLIQQYLTPSFPNVNTNTIDCDYIHLHLCTLPYSVASLVTKLELNCICILHDI